MLGCRRGNRGWASYLFSNFCSVFALLLIVVSWLAYDSLLCLFHCFFFAFFVSGPSNYALLEHGNCSVCFIKPFQKSGF